MVRCKYFLFNFVMELKWWSSITWFSQIWLQTKCEKKRKRKRKRYFYVLGYLVELIIKIWQPQNIYILNIVNLGHFFHENLLYRLRSIFFKSKFGKIFPKKKSNWVVGANLLEISLSPSFLRGCFSKEGRTSMYLKLRK
jgi:hypothetical protein